MTPDDLAAIEAEHQPHDSPWTGTWCVNGCPGQWPCDTRRLLDERLTAYNEGFRLGCEQTEEAERARIAEATERLREALAWMVAAEGLELTARDAASKNARAALEADDDA